MRTPGYLVRLLVNVAAIGLIAASCSDDKVASDTSVVPSTEFSTTTAADEPPVNPDPVVVELHAGAIVVSQTVFAAGVINFEATNLEETPHVLAIARGDSYEALPSSPMVLSTPMPSATTSS